MVLSVLYQLKPYKHALLDASVPQKDLYRFDTEVAVLMKFCFTSCQEALRAHFLRIDELTIHMRTVASFGTLERRV